jgi:hypothetical protein
LKAPSLQLHFFGFSVHLTFKPFSPVSVISIFYVPFQHVGFIWKKRGKGVREPSRPSGRERRCHGPGKEPGSGSEDYKKIFYFANFSILSDLTLTRSQGRLVISSLFLFGTICF